MLCYIILYYIILYHIILYYSQGTTVVYAVRRCAKSRYAAHDRTSEYKFRREKRTVAVPRCSGCLR